MMCGKISEQTSATLCSTEFQATLFCFYTSMWTHMDFEICSSGLIRKANLDLNHWKTKNTDQIEHDLKFRITKNNYKLMQEKKNKSSFREAMIGKSINIKIFKVPDWAKTKHQVGNKEGRK